MEKQEFYSKLLTFFKQLHPADEINNIPESKNLHDLGILDSLNMVELILFLEQVTSKEIFVEDFDVRKLYTMIDLYETFCVQE